MICKCGTSDPNCFFDGHDICADCEAEELDAMRQDFAEIFTLASTVKDGICDLSNVAFGAIRDIATPHVE